MPYYQAFKKEMEDQGKIAPPLESPPPSIGLLQMELILTAFSLDDLISFRKLINSILVAQQALTTSWVSIIEVWRRKVRGLIGTPVFKHALYFFPPQVKNSIETSISFKDIIPSSTQVSSIPTHPSSSKHIPTLPFSIPLRRCVQWWEGHSLEDISSCGDMVSAVSEVWKVLCSVKEVCVDACVRIRDIGCSSGVGRVEEVFGKIKDKSERSAGSNRREFDWEVWKHWDGDIQRERAIRGRGGASTLTGAAGGAFVNDIRKKVGQFETIAIDDGDHSPSTPTHHSIPRHSHSSQHYSDDLKTCSNSSEQTAQDKAEEDKAEEEEREEERKVGESSPSKQDTVKREKEITTSEKQEKGNKTSNIDAQEGEEEDFSGFSDGFDTSFGFSSGTPSGTPTRSATPKPCTSVPTSRASSSLKIHRSAPQDSTDEAEDSHVSSTSSNTKTQDTRMVKEKENDSTIIRNQPAVKPIDLDSANTAAEADEGDGKDGVHGPTTTITTGTVDTIEDRVSGDGATHPTQGTNLTSPIPHPPSLPSSSSLRPLFLSHASVRDLSSCSNTLISLLSSLLQTARHGSEEMREVWGLVVCGEGMHILSWAYVVVSALALVIKRTRVWDLQQGQHEQITQPDGATMGIIGGQGDSMTLFQTGHTTGKGHPQSRGRSSSSLSSLSSCSRSTSPSMTGMHQYSTTCSCSLCSSLFSVSIKLHSLASDVVSLLTYAMRYHMHNNIALDTVRESVWAWAGMGRSYEWQTNGTFSEDSKNSGRDVGSDIEGQSTLMEFKEKPSRGTHKKYRSSSASHKKQLKRSGSASTFSVPLSPARFSASTLLAQPLSPIMTQQERAKKQSIQAGGSKDLSDAHSRYILPLILTIPLPHADKLLDGIINVERERLKMEKRPRRAIARKKSLLGRMVYDGTRLDSDEGIGDGMKQNEAESRHSNQHGSGSSWEIFPFVSSIPSLQPSGRRSRSQSPFSRHSYVKLPPVHPSLSIARFTLPSLIHVFTHTTDSYLRESIGELIVLSHAEREADPDALDNEPETQTPHGEQTLPISPRNKKDTASPQHVNTDQLIDDAPVIPKRGSVSSRRIREQATDVMEQRGAVLRMLLELSVAMGSFSSSASSDKTKNRNRQSTATGSNREEEDVVEHAPGHPFSHSSVQTQRLIPEVPPPPPPLPDGLKHQVPNGRSVSNFRGKVEAKKLVSEATKASEANHTTGGDE
ncbi:Tryptophanase, partial [Aduncisulcus paluster]